MLPFSLVTVWAQSARLRVAIKKRFYLPCPRSWWGPPWQCFSFWSPEPQGHCGLFPDGGDQGGSPVCLKPFSDSRRYRSLRELTLLWDPMEKLFQEKVSRQCSHQFPENRASPMKGHPFQHIELDHVTEVRGEKPPKRYRLRFRVSCQCAVVVKELFESAAI